MFLEELLFSVNKNRARKRQNIAVWGFKLIRTRVAGRRFFGCWKFNKIMKFTSVELVWQNLGY